VRVRSYVRVWESWIRLVECDLEVTLTHGGNPEKHSLRIVRLAHSTSLSHYILNEYIYIFTYVAHILHSRYCNVHTHTHI
jgi:acid phosphatase family membrane protein YuiD